MTEQLELAGPADASVHWFGAVKPPEPLGLVANVTVPLGDDFAPKSVSLTTAVHVVAWLTTTDAGAHVTLVEVERFVTVTSSLPELVWWVVEPLYEPVIVCVPSPADGVYVTVQVDDVAPGVSVHEAPGLVNPPVPLDTKLTEPVGPDFVPALVSETVAVHVVGWLSATVLGKQSIDVEVDRFVTVTSPLPELIRWVGEPLYEPVMVWVPRPEPGVYVTEQVDDVAPGVSVHEDPGFENAPVPLDTKLTEPVGPDFVPTSVSDTVAVQVVPSARATELGEQLTLVEVERLLTVSESEPLLPRWLASPP